MELTVQTYLDINLRQVYTMQTDITSFYQINTSEIPSELSRENFISSHVKITRYLHTWRDHRRYGYIINPAFFTGVYIINSLVRYRVEHSKMKFVSTHGHVISSISLLSL